MYPPGFAAAAFRLVAAGDNRWNDCRTLQLGRRRGTFGSGDRRRKARSAGDTLADDALADARMAGTDIHLDRHVR